MKTLGGTPRQRPKVWPRRFVLNPPDPPFELVLHPGGKSAIVSRAALSAFRVARVENGEGVLLPAPADGEAVGDPEMFDWAAVFPEPLLQPTASAATRPSVANVVALMRLSPPACVQVDANAR